MTAEPRRIPLRLVAAEARKLLSTRSAVVALAAPVVYPALVVATARSDDATPSNFDAIEALRGAGDVLPVIWLLIGALAVAGEFRDGSIVSTLIAVPHRTRLLAAKLVALAAIAVLTTAGAIAVALGSVAVAGPETSLDPVSGPDLARTIAAVLVVAVLFAVTGAGLGEIVRQPTAAAVGILVWMLAAENALPAAFGYDDTTRWVSSRAAAAVVDVARPEPDTIGALTGLAVLGAIAVVVVAVGAVAFERRDVAG